MFRLQTILLGIFISTGILLAADGDVHSFELTWQKNCENYGFSEPFDRDTRFDKEPEFGSNEIYRGLLHYPMPTSDNAEVGFVWDKSEGKLYVDLNKDGDLTNDPNGVLENKRNGYPDYQEFPAFPLSFSSQQGVFRYHVAADMRGYKSFEQAIFRICSGYSGKADLYGRQWRFSVNDNFEGVVQQGSTMSVSPTGEDGGNRISSLSVPKSLFLDGRCYEVNFEFTKSENDYPALWCTLTEKTVPLAILRVQGKWVSQLVLECDDMLALPTLTEEAFFVPAQSFVVKQCCLRYEKDKPVISPQSDMPSVDLSPNQESVLKIGGPLRNSVDIERMGKVLKFNYTLVGVGGEKYDAQQITQYDNEKKPSVAIYKGDMQVSSGNFEYG